MPLLAVRRCVAMIAASQARNRRVRRTAGRVRSLTAVGAPGVPGQIVIIVSKRTHELVMSRLRLAAALIVQVRIVKSRPAVSS